MANVNKAINYINANGNEIEKARLKGILLKTYAPEKILDELKKIQNPDGGFSYWTKECSTVFDTVFILTWLDDLQLRGGDIVDKAFEFLIKHLKDDSGWDEVDTVKDISSETALTPGELETQVFLTAYCAHWFIRFERPEPLISKGKPLEFLNSHRSTNGLILDDQQATWDSLVLFSIHPGKDSDLFAESIEIIEKLFNPDELKGGNLAYLLSCLRDAGLDAFHPMVNLSTDELVQKQQDDGSWESEYGDEYSVGATIEALRVLKHYNVV